MQSESGGSVELRGVSKVYADGHVALRDVDLRVEAGTTLALLGPSGCGKTTTLKLINRLVAPTHGQVLVGARDVAGADPIELRRHIGYVVQHAGLFPHMTAQANVEIVPSLLGWPRPRRTTRARELFALVGLDFEQLARRYPAQLSGGQQQRVGIARALAADPPILLMDEPFGALDPVTRQRLQGEFAELQRQLRKTVVLVTHDADEAFRLADQVGVLAHGRVVQRGSPEEIRANPATDFVRAFVRNVSASGA